MAAQDFLVFVGVSFADIGSFALAMVLLVVTLYYLILYKLQEEVGGNGSTSRVCRTTLAYSCTSAAARAPPVPIKRPEVWPAGPKGECRATRRPAACRFTS
jgi:hypothetical protein